VTSPVIFPSCDGLALGLLALIGIVAFAFDAGLPRAFGADLPNPIFRWEPAEPIEHGYDDYVGYREKSYADDVDGAKDFGITPAPFSAYRATMFTRQEFETGLFDPRYQCKRMLYWSDGLKVVAYLYQPKDTTGKKLPLILYARGGNGDFGDIGTFDMLEFHPLLEAGFVILATQYRGSDGGEGRDEYGGADVHDVLNLIPVAKSLGYLDLNNVFLYGVSRGGIEALLAMQQHIPINAAAVVGASTDEKAENDRRPLTEIYQRLVPNFDRDPQAAFRARSAVDWPQDLNQPILLLHGGLDWRVSPQRSIDLASALQKLNKPYQLIIYAGDDHMITLHRQEKNQQIIDWFRRYMR